MQTYVHWLKISSIPSARRSAACHEGGLLEEVTLKQRSELKSQGHSHRCTSSRKFEQFPPASFDLHSGIIGTFLNLFLSHALTCRVECMYTLPSKSQSQLIDQGENNKKNEVHCKKSGYCSDRKSVV